MLGTNSGSITEGMDYTWYDDSRTMWFAMLNGMLYVKQVDVLNNSYWIPFYRLNGRRHKEDDIIRDEFLRMINGRTK